MRRLMSASGESRSIGTVVSAAVEQTSAVLERGRDHSAQMNSTLEVVRSAAQELQRRLGDLLSHEAKVAEHRREEAMAVMGDIERLQADRAAIERQIEAARKQAEEEAAQIAEGRAQVASLQASIQAQRVELDEAKQALFATRSQSSEVLMQQRLLVAEAGRLQSAIAEAQAGSAGTSSAIRTAEQAAHKTEVATREIMGIRTAHELAAARNRGEIASLRALVEAQGMLLTGLQSQQRQLSDTLTAARRREADAAMKFAMAKHRLQLAEREHRSTANDKAAARAALEVAGRQVTTLQAEVATLRARLSEAVTAQVAAGTSSAAAIDPSGHGTLGATAADAAEFAALHDSSDEEEEGEPAGRTSRDTLSFTAGGAFNTGAAAAPAPSYASTSPTPAGVNVPETAAPVHHSDVKPAAETVAAAKAPDGTDGSFEDAFAAFDEFGDAPGTDGTANEWNFGGFEKDKDSNVPPSTNPESMVVAAAAPGSAPGLASHELDDTAPAGAPASATEADAEAAPSVEPAVPTVGFDWAGTSGEEPASTASAATAEAGSSPPPAKPAGADDDDWGFGTSGSAPQEVSASTSMPSAAAGDDWGFGSDPVQPVVIGDGHAAAAVTTSAADWGFETGTAQASTGGAGADLADDWGFAPPAPAEEAPPAASGSSSPGSDSVPSTTAETEAQSAAATMPAAAADGDVREPGATDGDDVGTPTSPPVSSPSAVGTADIDSHGVALPVAAAAQEPVPSVDASAEPDAPPPSYEHAVAMSSPSAGAPSPSEATGGPSAMEHAGTGDVAPDTPQASTTAGANAAPPSATAEDGEADKETWDDAFDTSDATPAASTEASIAATAAPAPAATDDWSGAFADDAFAAPADSGAAAAATDHDGTGDGGADGEWGQDDFFSGADVFGAGTSGEAGAADASGEAAEAAKAAESPADAATWFNDGW